MDAQAGWICGILMVVAVTTIDPATRALDLPLHVRELDGLKRVAEPVRTGLPLPRSAVPDAAKLALLGPTGHVVPAQFTPLAHWADGSVKWLLCEWLVSLQPNQSQTFRLRDDIAPATPPRPLYLHDNTNEVTVDTGPLWFILNKHGFDGFAKACLDLDLDGRFDRSTELIVGAREDGGLQAIDNQGRLYTSRWGRVQKVQIERSGPLHAVICFAGDMRDRQGRVLLNYAIRFGVDAGLSRVRLVCTITNRRPCGRINGDRWVLGQSGSVLLESLDFVLPARMQGLRRVTLSAGPEQLWDRLPDPPRVLLYQDSSGGQNWFSRTHVNRDNRIPLQFQGWRAWYGQTLIGQGLRAEPWIDLSDLRWGVAVAVPKFWQNFPKSLSVQRDTIRIGLWPAEFDDLHELQGGEQKTSQWTIYFHHRRANHRTEPMPYPRQLMPTVHRPLKAWAPAQWYFSSGVLDPHVPFRPGRFPAYEALIQSCVTGQPQNMFTHRERADEYGWRNYGDSWAHNEHDRTGGPHDGLRVVSHYNNEYDHGWQMLLQCLRTVDASPTLWRRWWELAEAALWHEADLDIYHTHQDRTAVYNGGMFTHTAHGVDAGRSTHRGSPRDELWGQLNWPWKRGSSPESGHFNTRGMLHLYLLTGDRHLFDAAWELTDLVAMKVQTGQFAQIHRPTREAANNLQILTDAYLLTWDQRYRSLAEKVVAASSYKRVAVRSGPSFRPGWSTALYLQALGRYIEVLRAEKDLLHQQAIDSLLGYTNQMLERTFRGPQRGFDAGSWNYRFADAMMLGWQFESNPDKRQRYLTAAKAAFESLSSRVGPDKAPVFWNSKTSTILMGGAGRYLHYLTHRQPHKH